MKDKVTGCLAFHEQEGLRTSLTATFDFHEGHSLLVYKYDIEHLLANFTKTYEAATIYLTRRRLLKFFMNLRQDPPKTRLLFIFFRKK